jgi:prepilin-type N-terminal cleavage/methylation domain-containing protein
MRRASGFTLVELVLVMIVISVGLLGIASMFGNTSKSLSTNETVQQAAQYAQECAETVIALRRNVGFDAVSGVNTMCSTNPGGMSRAVSWASASGVNATDACPVGINCKNVTITVTGGGSSSSVTLMLVDHL